MPQKKSGQFDHLDNTGTMLGAFSEARYEQAGPITLEPGDIIATGTPHGVSEIREGDSINAYIDGVGTLRHPVLHE